MFSTELNNEFGDQSGMLYFQMKTSNFIWGSSFQICLLPRRL